MVLGKILESPLDCKEIQPVHPKGDLPWVFIGKSDIEAPVFWLPDANSWLILKDYFHDIAFMVLEWKKNISLKSPFSSVQFSSSVMSNSLRPHGLQHTRLPCLWPTPGACSNSCSLSQWCHQTIPSSVILSPPAFNLSQHQGLFQRVSSSHGGQSIEVSASASVLPMNIQDWSFLGLTGLISLQSKGLSRVFSNTTVQKHQFFCA